MMRKIGKYHENIIRKLERRLTQRIIVERHPLLGEVCVGTDGWCPVQFSFHLPQP